MVGGALWQSWGHALGSPPRMLAGRRGDPLRSWRSAGTKRCDGEQAVPPGSLENQSELLWIHYRPTVYRSCTGRHERDPRLPLLDHQISESRLADLPRIV